MKINAAILWEQGAPLSVEEAELQAPHAGEVLVELKAAGVCQSDLHPARWRLARAHAARARARRRWRSARHRRRRDKVAHWRSHSLLLGARVRHLSALS